jgi:hypothetical protein
MSILLTRDSLSLDPHIDALSGGEKGGQIRVTWYNNTLILM